MAERVPTPDDIKPGVPFDTGEFDSADYLDGPRRLRYNGPLVLDSGEVIDRSKPGAFTPKPARSDDLPDQAI
jgi:hypothetical protein